MKTYILLKDSIFSRAGTLFYEREPGNYYENDCNNEVLDASIVEKCSEWFKLKEDVQAPKKPWEIYPDFQSTVKEGKESFAFTLQGAVNQLPQTKEYPFTTSEAIAKRQLAEIQLMAIAEAWNDRVFGSEYWMVRVIERDNRLKSSGTTKPFKHLIIFNSEELAEKSIELHKELWNNYYCI